MKCKYSKKMQEKLSKWLECTLDKDICPYSYICSKTKEPENSNNFNMCNKLK